MTEFLPECDDGYWFGEHACIRDYIPDFPEEVDIDFSLQWDSDYECCQYYGWFYHSGTRCYGRWVNDDVDFSIDPWLSEEKPKTWGDLFRCALIQVVDEILDTESWEDLYDAPLLYHLKTARLREWYPQWLEKGTPLTKETPPWET
jgi:hypothetical protein